MTDPPRPPWRLVPVLTLVPIGAAATYLVIVAARFPRIIADIHLNPDASWAPVLARDLASDRHGGHILVGAASQFTAIWFLVLTRWVPFRDAIWDVAPYLTFLAGLLVVAWACRRIAGLWPAVLTFALAACGNSAVLLTVMSEGIHGNTYVADGLLGAFLVYWATRSPDRVWWGRILVVAMVVIAGSSLASDTLFLASGLGPFLGAALVLWLLRRDRRSGQVALLSTGITAASVVLAGGADRLMTALGFRRTYETGGYALASRRLALANVAKFGRGVRLLGNATPAAGHVGPLGATHLLMLVFVVGAVVLPFVLLGHALHQGHWTTRPWSDGTDEARLLYLAFWILSGLAVGIAFSITTFADGPSDPSRYVLPAFFALAATVPVWGSQLGWRRITVAVGATLFCVLSITEGQTLFQYGTGFHQTAAQGPAVISFLETQGVTVGYTGYFDSHPLTLEAGLRVHFYPVNNCRAPASYRLCPFYVNARTAWYLPRPSTRTFVLFDADTPADVAAVPTTALGAPELERRFGVLYVFIYDYDVAARFTPPCPANAVNPLACPNKPL